MMNPQLKEELTSAANWYGVAVLILLIIFVVNFRDDTANSWNSLKTFFDHLANRMANLL